MKKNGYGSNASDSSGTPKTKFQSFNANALLPKASHVSPNVPQRGYGSGGGGMQMLGRSSGARANPAAPLPVNLPSIKRETTGSIGSTSTGTWGSRPMGFSGTALAQSPPSNLSAKPSLDRPSGRTGLTSTSSPAVKDAPSPAPAWGGKGIPALANNVESGVSTPATEKAPVGPGQSVGDATQGQGDPSFPSLGAKPLSSSMGAAKVESSPTVVRTTREAAGELSDWAEDPEETMNFSMPLELEFVTTKASEAAEKEASTDDAKEAEAEAEGGARLESAQDAKGAQPVANSEGKGLRFVSAKKLSVAVPPAGPTGVDESADAQTSSVEAKSAEEPAPESATVKKPANPQGHGLADGQRELLRQKAEERGGLESTQDAEGAQPVANSEGKGLRFVSAKKSSVAVPPAKPTGLDESADAQTSSVEAKSADEPAPESATVKKLATPQGHGLADGQRELLRQKAEERRKEEEERVRVQKERSMAKLKELEQRIFERSSQQPKVLEDSAPQPTEQVNSGDPRISGPGGPSEEARLEKSAVETSSKELVDESSQTKNVESTTAHRSEFNSSSAPKSQLESSGMVKSILARPSKGSESTGSDATAGEAAQKHLEGGLEQAPVKVDVDEHEAVVHRRSSSPAKDQGEGSAPSSTEARPSSSSPKLQSSRRIDRPKGAAVAASSPKPHRKSERNIEAQPAVDPNHSPTVKRGRAGVHESAHRSGMQKSRDRSTYKEEQSEGVVHMVLNSEDNAESSVTGRKKVQRDKRDKLSKRIKLKKTGTMRGDDPQNREKGDSRVDAGHDQNVNDDSSEWQKVKNSPVTSRSNNDEHRSSKADRYGVVEKSEGTGEAANAHEGIDDDAGSDGWKEVKARRPDRKKFDHPQSQQARRKDRRQRSPVEGYQDRGRKPRDSRSGDTGRVPKPAEPRQVEAGEKMPAAVEEKVWQMKRTSTAAPPHSADVNVEAATASKPGASYHSVARNGQKPRSYVDCVQDIRPEAREAPTSKRSKQEANESQAANTSESYSKREDHRQSARVTSEQASAWQIKPAESPRLEAEQSKPAHMDSKSASSPGAEESKAISEEVPDVWSKDSAFATKAAQQKHSPRLSKEHETLPPGGKKPNLKKGRNQNKRGKADTAAQGDPTVSEANLPKAVEGESGASKHVDTPSKLEAPAKKHHLKDRKTEKPASTMATRGRARMNLKGMKVHESGSRESTPILPDSSIDRKGQELPDARGGEQATTDSARSRQVEKAQKSRKRVKKSESATASAPRSSPMGHSPDSKNAQLANWKPSVEDSSNRSWGSAEADPRRNLVSPKPELAKAGAGKEPQEGISRSSPKRELNRKKPSSRRKPYSDKKQSTSGIPEGSLDTAVEVERATESVQNAQPDVTKPRKPSSRPSGKGAKGEAKGVTGEKGAKGEAKGVTGDQVWVEKVLSTKVGVPGTSEALSSPNADPRVEKSGKNALVPESDNTSIPRHKSKNLSWEVKKKDSQSRRNDPSTSTVQTNGKEMEGGKPVPGHKKGFKPNGKKRTTGGRASGGFKAVNAQPDVTKPRKPSSRQSGKGAKGEAKGVTGDQVWVEKVPSTKAGVSGTSEALSSPKADPRVEKGGKNALAPESDNISTPRHKSKSLSWEVKKKDSQGRKNDLSTPTEQTNGKEMEGGKPVPGHKKGFKPNGKKRTTGGRASGGFKAGYVPKDRSDDVGKEASTQPTQSTEA
eukprot:CAMPEP_0184751744 /NCGR_PEP_ID=MMETSP0315-20130426/43208_1 /TAXON_ID=101924 /ORGANISM="Rhodosorus marinus, Strain UTEX LB 2760" /LENGTH=1701 /DNA_ID=CAMNT_0027231029 /DNA_START=202 /DNA_END=5309 /DNA_ORIENTATION=-